VERNKNFLAPELIETMRSSKNPVIVTLFTNLMTKTGNLTIYDDDVKQTRWTSAVACQPQLQKVFFFSPKLGNLINTKIMSFAHFYFPYAAI